MYILVILKSNLNNLLPDNFELSKEFKDISEQIEHSDDNFYITGKAGSGKSTLLSYFRTITQKKVAVLAPTGVAAIRIKGQTIHSFFRFPPKVMQTKHIRKVWDQDILLNLDVLIIDEISMVRADIFDAIDYSLRVHRKKLTKPFGGVQLVVFGDLFQLPPVVNFDESDILRRLYPNGSFFFHSNIFQDSHFHKIELQYIYRQKDEYFIQLLNGIRDGSITNSELNDLNQSVSHKVNMQEGKIILTTTNAQANKFNQDYLSQVPGEELNFRAQAQGNFGKEIFPTDELLRLKQGAQVLMIKNDPEKRWVNGSIGKIHSIAEKKIKVFIDGKIYEVRKEKWERIQYQYDDSKEEISEKVVGSFKQYPMKLAWAITIHKSQGQTFDQVIIDISRGAFAAGQLYVAMSRCKTLDGVELVRPILKSDIMVNQDIVSFQN